MPFVNIRTIKGLLTDEQKKLLHKKITDVMVEVEGQGDESFRQNIWIYIEDEEPINCSQGGFWATPEYIAGLHKKK
ncbi:MAG: tautomerase family protein [Dehalococcoidia bacterium]|nr:tautomerase family protein [Dehalococcoidia bacterium]MDD5493199.1 tautomerase family protein [Dehalococcoidia bacterium]